MVHGLWSMVYGLWSMVYGLRSTVHGLGFLALSDLILTSFCRTP